MARVETITLISDLDQSVAADETVGFAIDGKSFKIDLSAEQAEQFRDTLRPYVNAGRRDRGTGGNKTRRSSTNGFASHSVVREWARANGFPELANRGRIPANVTEAYVAAHAS